VLRAVLLASFLLLAACGSSQKEILFDVKEAGQVVTVRKQYSDGWKKADDPSANERAYQAAARGNIKEAIRLAKEAADAEPTSPLMLYNLAILYEANHQWAEARAVMVKAKPVWNNVWESVSIDEEIKFIDDHAKD
jgi:tetratricopeptide (TPR) repeat protein